jgi:hypothetical protein
MVQRNPNHKLDGESMKIPENRGLRENHSLSKGKIVRRRKQNLHCFCGKPIQLRAKEVSKRSLR